MIEFAVQKEYFPDDELGILHKRKELLKLALEPVGKGVTEKSELIRSQKVTTDALILLLKAVGVSTASADKTKIAQLISCLSGYSVQKIRQRLSNPDELNSFHKGEIENINKIFSDLKVCISINYNSRR